MKEVCTIDWMAEGFFLNLVLNFFVFSKNLHVTGETSVLETQNFHLSEPQ